MTLSQNAKHICLRVKKLPNGLLLYKKRFLAHLRAKPQKGWVVSLFEATMNNIILIELVRQGDPQLYGETMGVIEIGDFYEYFTIATDYWSVEDYKKQWVDGLERIKTCDSSALVASIQDPQKTPLLNWWILYKEGKNIYIQNKMYYAEIYEERVGKKTIVTPKNCYSFISQRRTHTDDGDLISEWKVSVD